MIVSGYQQEKRSWFTGFLEGEGSAHKPKKGSVCIRLANTNIDLINECIAYLKANYIFYHVYEDKRSNKNYRRGVCYDIQILGGNECSTLIKTLGSSFQCRQQEFIEKLGLCSSTTTRDVPLTADLYWLIGLFEAEGSFNISLNNKGSYVPDIVVNNTNKRLIDKFAITLKSLGLAWWSGYYEPSHPDHSTIYRVCIKGLLRAKRFLDLTKNLFISDYYQNRADLLSRFIESRLLKPKETNYSEEEHSIYWQLKVKI